MSRDFGFDSYIRVSDVGGRSGDSYITVDEQRRAIQETAERKSVKLSGAEVVDEDVSGSKAAAERGLEGILRRIEAGTSAGLIVAYQDRLSRGSLREQAEIWERLEKAGARLITGDGLDSADPGQELLFAVRAAIARDQWKRKQADWARSKRNAIERGIHFASVVPTGYVRERGTPLQPDPLLAPVVVGLFERRAKRWNFTELARWMNEQEHTNGTATRETVRSILANRTYLGEARSGEIVNRNAHPALVSQKLFDEVNAIKGRRPQRDGQVAAKLLVLGLATCANCGHRLHVGQTRKINRETGEYEKRAAYTCKNINCDMKAFAVGAELDAYVQTWVLTIPTDAGLIETEAKSDVAEARKQLGEAEYDKKLFVGNKELRRLLSAEEYAAELETLVEAVTEAQIALDMAVRDEQAASCVTVHQVWHEWDIQTRREYLAKTVASLTITSAQRKRIPLHERVQVELIGAMKHSHRFVNSPV